MPGRWSGRRCWGGRRDVRGTIATGQKTILAFGDSLTWDADPAGGGRHRFEDRWPGLLEAVTRAPGKCHSRAT